MLVLWCRPREDSGMGLKEVAIEHKKQHLIRRHQLAKSRDPQVREIYGHFDAFQHRKKTSALGHQLLECVEMDELLAEVKTGKGWTLKGRIPLALSRIWVNLLHLVPSPLKHLCWQVPTTERSSLMLMLKVFRSRLLL